jgi:hypothetical protein
MAFQNGYGHFYSYVLQGKNHILADERDKKILLDIVLGVQMTDELKIYAFCITDDAVCLLLGGADKTMINIGIRKVIAEYTAHRIKGMGTPDIRSTGAALTVTEKRLLRSETEVLQQCRAIHLRPVVEGYVTNVRNYWWSSYQTYLGYYNWSQVDCSGILQLFSSNMDTAGRKFRRYHETMPS